MNSVIRKILRYIWIGFSSLILLWIVLKLIIPTKEVPLPSIAHLSNDEKTEFLSYLQKSGLSPEDYIISKFKHYDVIMLGEFHRVQHDPIFVQHLIPILYRNGIHLLGFEFACPEDQSRLDQLLSGTTYDESLAISIMRNLDGEYWPFQEYLDIFKAAWELNASLPQHMVRFRILPMTAFVDAEKLNYGTEQERLEQQRRTGFTDSLIAEIVDREALQKGNKILVYCGRHHAFSKFRQPRFEEDSVKCLGGYFEDRGGQRIFRKHPDKIITIMLHSPFPYPSYRTYGLPWDGIIDQVFETYHKPVGFDITDSPFSRIIDSTSVYSCGRGRLSLSEFCDGYIMLDHMSNYRCVTLVPNWFDGVSFADFKRHFIIPLPFFIFHQKLLAWYMEAEKYPPKYFSKFQHQLEHVDGK